VAAAMVLEKVPMQMCRTVMHCQTLVEVEVAAEMLFSLAHGAQAPADLV